MYAIYRNDLTHIILLARAIAQHQPIVVHGSFVLHHLSQCNTGE